MAHIVHWPELISAAVAAFWASVLLLITGRTSTYVQHVCAQAHRYCMVDQRVPAMHWATGRDAPVVCTACFCFCMPPPTGVRYYV
jgi:hypothetical protein